MSGFDGYTPVPAGLSVHTAPSAPRTAPSARHAAPSTHHTAPSAPPAPSTHHAAPSAPQHLTYDINHIEEEPTGIAPPAYESLFGAANAAISRTTAMVSGKMIPTQHTSYSDAPEPAGRKSKEDVAATKQKKTGQADPSDTCCDVFWKFVGVNFLICGIPIAQLVMGLVYMNECPISGGKVQIYLIINGAVFVLIGMRLWLPNQIDKYCSCLGNTLNILALVGCLFLIAWFVVGSVWVFKIYKTVEYEKREKTTEHILKVTPDKEIDAPFQSNKFKITTKYGTDEQELKIYWNGNPWDNLVLKKPGVIDACDHLFDDYKDGNGTKMGGVWSFLVTSDSLKIWFDEELALYVTKYNRKGCYFWDDEIKSIKLNGGAITLQFDDEQLNKETFGKDVYCNKAMYLFAFWLLIIIYVILGALSVVAFCM